jgi:hypothetical protein
MLKPTFIILMTTLFLCAYTCKKSKLQNPKTVTEVYKYSDQENTPCTGKLKHDSEEVVIKGYINKLNTFAGEKRFHVFESADISSVRIEIQVTDKSDEIFKKISDKLGNLKEDEFKSITILGSIAGKPLYLNGSCKMGTLINLSSAENIYLK